MKPLYERLVAGRLPKLRQAFAKMDEKPRAARQRRLSVVVLGIAASAVLVLLPVTALAARKHHAAHKRGLRTFTSWVQPMWTSYLPGGSKSKKPSPSPTPAPTPAPAGSLTNGSYSNGSGTLAYELYVPTSYKAGSAVPLVVALHGCTQNADVFRQLSGWDRLAESKGFIVLFPQQSSSNNQFTCWNFFQQADMSRGSGEPAVIAGMTQMVQQKYSVDTKRTYVNGLSAGGAMTSVMAATYPDIYAAGGIGSGCEYDAGATCAGYQSNDPTTAGQAAYSAMGSYARMMPMLVFQGDQDTTVPPINAQQAVQQWQTTDGLVVHGTMPASPTSTTNGFSAGGQSYTLTKYGDGSGHELIQYWLVHGMNHAWSGGNSSQQYADPAGPDETAAMWAFFVNHPMP